MSEEQTGLIVLEQANVLQIFSTVGGLDPLVKQIEEAAVKLAGGIDISTVKGRKELISIAAKVTKSKTGLDDMRKELTADWAAKKKIVDDNWKTVEKQLAEVKRKIRQPVTDFEEAEEKRVNDIKGRLSELEALPVREFEGAMLTAEQLQSRLDIVRAYQVEEVTFGEFTDTAKVMRDNAINSLTSYVMEATKQEAQAEELADLKEAQRVQDEKNAATDAKAKAVREEIAKIKILSLIETLDGVPYQVSHMEKSQADLITIYGGITLEFFGEFEDVARALCEAGISKLETTIKQDKERYALEAKIEEDTKRKDAIVLRIENIQIAIDQTVEFCTTSHELSLKLEGLQNMAINDTYAEFMGEALKVQHDGIKAIEKAITAAKEREEKDREEIAKTERDRIQAEQDAATKKEVQELAKREADEENVDAKRILIFNYLMNFKVSEGKAELIASSIIQGRMPNVTVNF